MELQTTPNHSQACARTLAALPSRVLRFLHTLATRPTIRAQLRAGGYAFEDHDEGLTLLNAVLECRDRKMAVTTPLRTSAAMAELRQWVAIHFRRYRLAMQRLHPEAVELFPDVDTRSPMESVLAMAHLVERLGHADPAVDARLLSTLARRGLNRDELERLSRLVVEAQGVDQSADNGSDDQRQAELLALYAWYREWSETARHLITRKDFRIMLGIGAKSEGTTEVE